MRIRLTDRELILLGWDEPDERTDPATVRAIVAKANGRLDLTEDEVQRLEREARYLPSPGETDPAEARTATRLRNKIDAIRE